jgi:hypothetical protein
MYSELSLRENLILKGDYKMRNFRNTKRPHLFQIKISENTLTCVLYLRVSSEKQANVNNDTPKPFYDFIRKSKLESRSNFRKKTNKLKKNTDFVARQKRKPHRLLSHLNI